MPDVGLIILVSVLLSVVAIGIIMLVLVYQKKQLQYINEKEQMKANFEKEILESRLEMQEQTMKNISQEIHDNIGQVLSVIKLNVALINGNETPALLQQKIKDISGLTGKVIQDLRDLSKSLNSDTISEKGLVKSIEYELDTLKRTGSYEVILTVEGEPSSLHNKNDLILFRIFQEILNNIIKHADATLIKVVMRFSNNDFFLEVNDNGKGFDTSNLNGNGLGIRNMKNRSRMIGADYNITSGLTAGTCIKIQLPVNNPA